jgi:hypothetical protein
MSEVGGPATDSPEHWRHVRGVLREHRHELSSVAARLYPDAPRVGSTKLLSRAQWIPDKPLPLDDLPLSRAADVLPVTDGTGPESAHVRPCRAATRYPTYAEAVADLDRPALFENRMCYRLTEASLVDRPRLGLAQVRYFDAVNVGHAVAHELAAAWEDSPTLSTMAGQPLRTLVGDPCDLPRRPGLLAVTTLTLRRAPGGEVSFLLHWRDPARVNHAGGLYQVMPVGVFQPIADTPAAIENDFSLWRCMARELSEELLDASEEYETRDGVLDYEGWPLYRRLTAARRAGKLTIHSLGVGVDPLTFATDILTVAVFDADVFDAAFDGLVTRNAEGRVITQPGSAGIPFDTATVARFSGGQEPMQESGAALLQLAWQHRRHLLG